MSFVDQLNEIIFHLVDWLFLFLSILFSSSNEMKISFISLKEQLISKVNTVLITTDLMKAIHVELNKIGTYLSNEGLKFSVSEEFMQDTAFKLFLIKDDELLALASPVHEVWIFLNSLEVYLHHAYQLLDKVGNLVLTFLH